MNSQASAAIAILGLALTSTNSPAADNYSDPVPPARQALVDVLGIGAVCKAVPMTCSQHRNSEFARLAGVAEHLILLVGYRRAGPDVHCLQSFETELPTLS